jgi:hypothetical protein
MARTRACVKGWEWRQELVAVELRWSPSVAGNRIEDARRLCEDLPRALDLLEAGMRPHRVTLQLCRLRERAGS